MHYLCLTSQVVKILIEKKDYYVTQVGLTYIKLHDAIYTCTELIKLEMEIETTCLLDSIR